MDIDDVFLCKPWDYVEEKNGAYLIIWPDLPNWMVVDKELFNLLKMFDGKRKIKDIIKSQTIESKDSTLKKTKQVKKIISHLKKRDIIHNKNRKKNERKKPKLWDVNIHLTNRCNLNCKMCCNDFNIVDKEKEISTEKIYKFLEEVKEFLADDASLSIIGGEPLLEPEKLLSIAKYGKKIGFNLITFSTNGLLITKDFVEKAKNLDLLVQVSLDGYNAEEHEFIRGKNTFKKTINNIKILTESNLTVVTNMLCHMGNINSLSSYFKLAQKLEVDYARFSPLKRIGKGVKTDLKPVPIEKMLKEGLKLYLQHPEYRKMMGMDYFSAFANRCRLSVKYDYCGNGLTTVLLNSDGSIYPCSGHTLPEFKAGDINKNSFRKIWLNSPVLNNLREKYKVGTLNQKCSQCIVRYWCQGGCRAEAYHVTKKLNSPALECEETKKSILKMFWILSENPDLGKGSYYNFD